jgi:small subunit ribosomal protein S9
MIAQEQATGCAIGTGRRKTAVARVRVRTGSGNILINNRSLEDYFPNDRDRHTLMAPLEHSGKRGQVDVRILVAGGGIAGQAGACLLGIARALRALDGEVEPALRQHGLLTRDSRMKERKKYGLHGARRGTQFSKR